MNYDDWIKSVPPSITADSLWQMKVYRLALFAAEIGWHDVTRLIQDKRTMELSDQLYSAIGSVGANISEGYSRGSNKDRARFYEYALGSARESRGWYYDGRHVLGETVANHRMELASQIVRILLTILPSERGYSLHEEGSSYGASQTEISIAPAADAEALLSLLSNVPMP